MAGRETLNLEIVVRVHGADPEPWPSEGNLAYLPVLETGASRFDSEGGYQIRLHRQNV